MAIAGIAWLFSVGAAFIGGFDLDGRSHVALDKPDVDEILARERRQMEAEKQRKAERREARTERRERPRKPPKPRKKKPSGGERSAPAARPGAGAGAPAPASTPPPAPQPAPQPDPATAEAPELPQQSAPQQPSEGPVDPRFY